VNTFDEQAPQLRPPAAEADDDIDGTVEIQRLLAWYFRDGSPRRTQEGREARDTA
jgi:hypothetical protein